MHISAHLDVDVVAVESADTVTVLLDLTAPEGAHDTERPAHTVVVVLDRSGSMAGERLYAAKSALLALVDQLDARDAFGLVTFDNQAVVVVPAAPVAQPGRDAIAARIDAILPGNTTDLSSGYLRGLQEAHRVVGPGGATVLLLSDGHANTGITEPARFRDLAMKASAETITTSTIGIGVGYDDQILTELAIGGSGNHTFAEEGDAAAAAVAGEVDGLLSKTVQAASLFIRPGDLVQSVGVLNDLPSQGIPGGVLVELGDCYSGEHRELLFTVGVPALAELGPVQVAQFELSYVAVPHLESHTVTLPIMVNVVPGDVAQGRVPDPQVRRHRLLLDVQTAKRDSERALRVGDPDAARRHLHDAREALAGVKEDPDGAVAGELGVIDEALAAIDDAQSAYSRRFLSSSRAKHARGYRGREQGGKA